ncbi:MAG: 50S ribosomal protein L10 [Bacilli bacterium]|jgi:large subunit ribosomal protein L10|nr:50S ribosomal protein L10 [Bacilli bacterium]
MKEKTLNAKKAVISEIQAKLKDATTLVVFEYRGMNVKQLTELRKALRNENTEVGIYKNSLVLRALDELGYGELAETLKGPNAFAFSNDVVSAPKTLARFARRQGFVVLKGGLVEGKVVNKEEMTTLSKLANREGMISVLLSVLQAPISQLARTVQAVADKAN